MRGSNFFSRETEDGEREEILKALQKEHRLENFMDRFNSFYLVALKVLFIINLIFAAAFVFKELI